MKYLKLIFFQSLVVFVTTTRPTDKRALLLDVLDVTEALLDFFSSDYSSINVDGLFGMRLGEGQLLMAIENCKSKKCPASVLTRLTSLENILKTTCDRALPYLEQSDPDYYERFLQTISSPYRLPYDSATISPEELGNVEIGNFSQYDEEKGDACYARLMGTYEENHKKTEKCNVTKNCIEMMTSKGTSRYVTTHQLLYFIVTEHVSCTDEIEKFIGDRKLTDIQRALCTSIYKEAIEATSGGNVLGSQRDIFLERVVLCGPLGYEDFLKEEWMKMTLRWPDRNMGCFKPHFYDTILKPRNERSTMRQLFREKTMKDGCLSHTSGLGFGTFCLYLRYLTQYM